MDGWKTRFLLDFHLFQALLLVSGRVQDNNRYCNWEPLELWRHRNQCLHESIPLQTSGSKPSFLHCSIIRIGDPEDTKKKHVPFCKHGLIKTKMWISELKSI